MRELLCRNVRPVSIDMSMVRRRISGVSQNRPNDAVITSYTVPMIASVLCLVLDVCVTRGIE